MVCRAVSCLMPKRFRMSGLSEKGVTSPPVFGADGISRIAHGASRRSRSAVALETKAFRIIPARGSRVRSGLAAGAKGVRTTSPTVNGADMGGARTNHGHHARSQLIRPPSLFANTWDHEFESASLQRGVCEPCTP